MMHTDVDFCKNIISKYIFLDLTCGDLSKLGQKSSKFGQNRHSVGFASLCFNCEVMLINMYEYV